MYLLPQSIQPKLLIHSDFCKGGLLRFQIQSHWKQRCSKRLLSPLPASPGSTLPSDPDTPPAPCAPSPSDGTPFAARVLRKTSRMRCTALLPASVRARSDSHPSS